MSGLINFLMLKKQQQLIDLTNSIIVCDGNSLTKGQGATPYPTQLSLLDGITGKNIAFYNYGVNGQQTSQMITDYNTQIASVYDNSKNCFYLVNEIGNDIYFNGNVTDAMSRFWQLCDMAKATGFKVGVIGLEDRSYSYYGTTTPSGDNDTVFREKLAECNNQLRQNWNLHGDFFVDLLATEELSDAWNTTYFTDRIHNTTAGYAVWAREIRKSLFNYCNIPL